MNRDAVITATTPGQLPLQRSLGDIHALIARSRGADSADVNCMLLDAGVPVTLTVGGRVLTLTPKARA